MSDRCCLETMGVFDSRVNSVVRGPSTVSQALRIIEYGLDSTQSIEHSKVVNKFADNARR